MKTRFVDNRRAWHGMLTGLREKFFVTHLPLLRDSGVERDIAIIQQESLYSLSPRVAATEMSNRVLTKLNATRAHNSLPEVGSRSFFNQLHLTVETLRWVETKLPFRARELQLFDDSSVRFKKYNTGRTEATITYATLLHFSGRMAMLADLFENPEPYVETLMQKAVYDWVLKSGGDKIYDSGGLLDDIESRGGKFLTAYGGLTARL